MRAVTLRGVPLAALAGLLSSAVRRRVLSRRPRRRSHRLADVLSLRRRLLSRRLRRRTVALKSHELSSRCSRCSRRLRRRLLSLRLRRRVLSLRLRRRSHQLAPLLSLLSSAVLSSLVCCRFGFAVALIGSRR